MAQARVTESFDYTGGTFVIPYSTCDATCHGSSCKHEAIKITLHVKQQDQKKAREAMARIRSAIEEYLDAHPDLLAMTASVTGNDEAPEAS